MNLLVQGSFPVFIRTKNQTDLVSKIQNFSAILKSASFREPKGSQEKVISELSLERILEISQAKGARESVKGTEQLEQK